MHKSINRLIMVSIIAGVMFGFALKGEARPPSKIELTYDKKKKLLHVVVKHVSDNMIKHYIRKIEVTKNDEKPMSYYFPAQTSAAELVTDVPLPAVLNDIIRVKAVCSEAGFAEETFMVTEQ